MSSAFFRRPTDSSSSSSDDENSEIDLPSHQSNNSDEGEIRTVTTESLPSHGSLSVGEEADIPAVANVDRHRTNLISALLEDFARNRASDYLNEANPGVKFDKSSPEVQSLAQSVYHQVSQSLALTGILPANNATDGNPQARAAYLAGIESLALGNVQNHRTLQGQARSQLQASEQQLAVARIDNQQLLPHVLQQSMANLSFRQDQSYLSSPYSDLILSQSPARQSHYESSFQQLRLLGKGGFGKVYHAYNIFDKKEYAVKKIPLSPRLSQRYRESGHKELESVLREVQALAQLEHNNVVRYHATWIEEPKRSPDASALYQPGKHGVSAQGQKLIADHPTHSPPGVRLPQAPTRAAEHSYGILFGADSRPTTPIRDVEGGLEPMWSANETEHEPSSARPSEIFTDGNARPSAAQDSIIDDSVYVLHVQMSVYPGTLAEYLAPAPTSNRGSAPIKRHCFHLMPALRILMGILCGLQYTHARGLIHRDIKPSNIFVSNLDLTTTELIPDGYHDVGSCGSCPKSNPYFINPRIGDFGLVAQLARDDSIDRSDGNQRPNKIVGTEYYRPPSQANVDEKVDVFALGVILIELLWPCMTSTERMHVLGDVQKGKIPPNLARKLDDESHQPGTGDLVIDCISGMIEQDARRRWGCAQIKDRLEMLLKRCEIHSNNGTGDGTVDGVDLDEMSRVRSVDEATDQTTSLDGQVQ
ncbi:hypothetical protein H2200_003131 [Cladophialophora chaetospira]|uniref:Protein kinase domain-containing protein n=1 Tax=Cladophialophora chaetospira TaxID=386627 RepID=A0AA39CLZ7_9EURO|nr:hypothetical protein H2200_003131 [Cladophialophora chaetospira]